LAKIIWGQQYGTVMYGSLFSLYFWASSICVYGEAGKVVMFIGL